MVIWRKVAGADGEALLVQAAEGSSTGGGGGEKILCCSLWKKYGWQPKKIPPEILTRVTAL
jgi:hypothetical protein